VVLTVACQRALSLDIRGVGTEADYLTPAERFPLLPVQEMKITLPIHGRGAADPARRESGAVGEAAREGSVEGKRREAAARRGDRGKWKEQ
jgi:hypothetical protein